MRKKKEILQNRQERADIAATAERLLEVFALEENHHLRPVMSLMEDMITLDEGSEKMTQGSWFLPGGELVEGRGFGFCMVTYRDSLFTFKLKADEEVYSYEFTQKLDVTENAVRDWAAENRLGTILRMENPRVSFLHSSFLAVTPNASYRPQWIATFIS